MGYAYVCRATAVTGNAIYKRSPRAELPFWLAVLGKPAGPRRA